MGLQKLYQAGFLSPSGIVQFLTALQKEGSNLMALLHFAKKKAAQKVAIQIEDQAISYQQLYQDSQALASYLHHDLKWEKGMRLALAAHNSYALIQLIFAASRLGVHLYLLNAEMSSAQLQDLQQRLKFDQLIIGQGLVLELAGKTTVLEKLVANKNSIRSVPKRRSGLLTVLTSGTSGRFKTAARKPSTTQFIAPFLALLKAASLDRYQRVFVATPIYHGFGLAAMIMALALRASIYLLPRFQNKAAAELIAAHDIEVMTAVPLIYQRLLQAHQKDLGSLQVVLCGGAPIREALVRASQEALGPVLYNLYGTSEAGFCIMASPKELAQMPASIGKAIRGVRTRLLDAQDMVVPEGKVGRICIKSAWAVAGQWTETGDLAYQQDGYFFICGRSDDMIVSGGENVYPIEVEQQLALHPQIQELAVLGVEDAEFGQRLVAFIQTEVALSEKEFLDWLKPKIARYQMPKTIIFLDQLPYNSLGKIDRKKLHTIYQEKNY